MLALLIASLAHASLHSMSETHAIEPANAADQSAARGDTAAVLGDKAAALTDVAATKPSSTDTSAKPCPPNQSTKPPKHPLKIVKLPPWMDARFAADASRTSVLLIILIVFASLTAPTLPCTCASSLLSTSLTWTGVTIAAASMSRVGATARRCAERVAGTLVGGVTGLVVAVAIRPSVTAIGAVIVSVVGEVFARGGASEGIGKLTLATFCLVALPALLDTQANSSAGVRETAEIAAARLGAIVVGVCLVAVASVVWFPR